MCGVKTMLNSEMPRAFNLAQGIENQVIREMVCSKVRWLLDRDSPFCKMSDCSGRIREKIGRREALTWVQVEEPGMK